MYAFLCSLLLFTNSPQVDIDARVSSANVVNEIGWEITAEDYGDMKAFLEETSYTPFLIIKLYDPAYSTKEAQEQWVSDFYDRNLTGKNIALVVYFEGKDSDGEFRVQVCPDKNDTIERLLHNNIDSSKQSDGSYNVHELFNTNSDAREVCNTILLCVALIAYGCLFAIICWLLFSVRKRRVRKK